MKFLILLRNVAGYIMTSYTSENSRPSIEENKDFIVVRSTLRTRYFLLLLIGFRVIGCKLRDNVLSPRGFLHIEKL